MEILQKVTELKAELDTYRPLDKDQEAAIMQKFRLDWNFHSNHLEGNSLTYGETKALILFGITASGKPLKDHFEITGHDEAIKWVEEVVKEDRPLTENFIRELHKLILKEPYESSTITPDGIPAKKIIQIGVYKTVPNHVLTPTGEIFRFATPEETPALMNDLIDWYREKENDPESHPLLTAAEFHYKFICIHPFDDGNGRTSRILMNFILMKHGYPPVIVKTEDKANYIAALQQADAGLIKPFIEYIGKNLEHSLDLMIRGSKGENIGEADDVDKEIALLKHELKNFDNRTPIKKSNEVKLKIFNESIRNLINEFVLKCSSFDDLYHEVKAIYYFEGSGTNASKENIIEEIMKGMSASSAYPNEISLGYEYKGFKKQGFNFFSHYSKLKIRFLEYEYEITNSNRGFKLTKPNYSNLTIEDINSVVSTEIKEHTQYIKTQIENAKQKTTNN